MHRNKELEGPAAFDHIKRDARLPSLPHESPVNLNVTPLMPRMPTKLMEDLSHSRHAS